MIGAILGPILGGITTMAGNSKYNSTASGWEKKIAKLAEKEARVWNKTQKKMLRRQIARYEEYQHFNYESILKNWEMNVAAQQYEYEQQIRMYEKDKERVEFQIAANNVSAKFAREGIQRQLAEVKTAKQFDLQGKLAESLKAMGQAQLGQAGQSSARLVNAHVAELGKTIAMMDASMNSALTQANVDMFQTTWQRNIDNRNTRLGAMFEPEKPQELAMPTIPELPEWKELKDRDVKAIAPLPRKSSGSGAAMGGILQGAGQIIGML